MGSVLISCVLGGVCICLDGAKFLLGCAVHTSLHGGPHVWDEVNTHIHCARDDHVHWHLWIEAVELGAAASRWWHCYPAGTGGGLIMIGRSALWRRARLECLRLICSCIRLCMHVGAHGAASAVMLGHAHTVSLFSWSLCTLCHCCHWECRMLRGVCILMFAYHVLGRLHVAHHEQAIGSIDFLWVVWAGALGHVLRCAV